MVCLGSAGLGTSVSFAPTRFQADAIRRPSSRMIGSALSGRNWMAAARPFPSTSTRMMPLIPVDRSSQKRAAAVMG
jgi:hypothetical protein